MRIPLPTGFPANLRQFLQRCGYATHFDPTSNRLSFVRRVQGSEYPRYHLYVNQDVRGQSYFNIHLDQKFASYRNAPAHNAEYDSPLVTREGDRLYQLLQQAVAPQPVAPGKRRGIFGWFSPRTD